MLNAFQHSINHGNMYAIYVELKCRNHMRELCKIAGASKSVSDIYEDAIIK